MREQKTADFLAVGAALLFLFLILLTPGQSLGNSREIGILDSAWTCTYGDTRAEVTLPASLSVPGESQVRFSTVLPEQESKGWGIRFRSRLQRVQVFLEETLIYQYPEQEVLGDVLPSVWNYVRLPGNWGGKQLEIRVESPYQGFGGLMQEVSIGNYNDLLLDTITSQLPYFIISLILGLLGGALILLSFVFRKYEQHRYQRTLGVLLVFVALWLCGESRMPLEFPGPEAVYIITMLSLVLLPSFILSYLGSRWPRTCSRFTERFLIGSLFCEGFLLILQVTEIWALPEMLPAVLVLLAGTLVYAAYLHIRAARSGQVRTSELVCVFLIMASASWEMLSFLLRRTQVGMYVRISFLIFALNFLRLTILRIYRVWRENYKLEQQLEISRLELMNSQIRPHFIYNTLNSIRALIRLDPERAYQAVYDFSTYLRGNMHSLQEKELIPFQEELKHIRAYLNIEKLRMGDRLRWEFQIENSDFLLPHLAIQPLVENAVKHGIWKKQGEGTVRILEREEPGFHWILVADDGTGFDPAALEEQEDTGHIGIRNIRLRIREISGGTVEIESKPGKGTRVEVRIPREPKKQGGDRHAGNGSG